MSPIMKKEAPSFHKHLLEYPNHRPEGLQESFSWAHFQMDKKPLYSLVHRMGMLYDGKVYVFSERQFYNSRNSNSVQGLGGAFPVDNNGGTVLVYVARASTDHVLGFGGSAKRSIGARIMSSKYVDLIERFRRKSLSSSDEEISSKAEL